VEVAMSSGTSRKDPIATAVVGMGGYAGRIIDLLLRTESDDDHPPRLVAVTSSNPTRPTFPTNEVNRLA